MTAKMIDQYASKLIYCGIIKEKWTHNEPVKAQFDGLVSVELFNEVKMNVNSKTMNFVDLIKYNSNKNSFKVT